MSVTEVFTRLGSEYHSNFCMLDVDAALHASGYLAGARRSLIAAHGWQTQEVDGGVQVISEQHIDHTCDCQSEAVS